MARTIYLKNHLFLCASVSMDEHLQNLEKMNEILTTTGSEVEINLASTMNNITKVYIRNCVKPRRLHPVAIIASPVFSSFS